MSRRGETPTPTPPTNEILEASVNDVSILTPGSSVQSASNKPTIHLKATRAADNVYLTLNFTREGQIGEQVELIPFVQGELEFDGTMTLQTGLPNGTNIMHLKVDGESGYAQTLGSIIIGE